MDPIEEDYSDTVDIMVHNPSINFYNIKTIPLNLRIPEFNRTQTVSSKHQSLSEPNKGQ